MIKQYHQNYPHQQTPIQAVSYKFHQELREKHIEKHKAAIRRERESVSNLNELLKTIPHELSDVLEWCIAVKEQSSQSESFDYLGTHVIEMYKILEKFPCLETITMFLNIIIKVPSEAIDELFKLDIMNLFVKLLTSPEKIMPPALFETSKKNIPNCMRVEIVKKTIHIIASLCEGNEIGRNTVVTHKIFEYLNEIYEICQEKVQTEYLLCLHSFVKIKFSNSEHMAKIIKEICFIFYFKFNQLNFREIMLIIECLKSIIKTKTPFAMDLIEDTTQYNIFEHVLTIIKHCNISILEDKKWIGLSGEQIGQMVHHLNIYMLFFMEISTNENVNKEGLIEQWFDTIQIESRYYQEARKCVYFQLTNYLIEEEENEIGNELQRKQLIEQCVAVFSRNIETEINEDILSDLVLAIETIFKLNDVNQYLEIIMENNLVVNCLEAITRNFYSVCIESAKALLEGIYSLIGRSNKKEIKQKYVSDIQCYEKKLQNLCQVYPELERYANKVICQAYDSVY